MKDKDNGVIFLKDWLLLIDSLSDENKLVFWDYFTSYEFGEDRMCENQFVAPTWNFIKKQLDNMREKYQGNVIERNRKNGSKGGRPRKETQITEPKTINPIKSNETEIIPKKPVGILETQKTPNEKDNVKDNNKDKDKDNVNDILLKKESKEENIIKENLETEFFPETEFVKNDEENSSKKVAEKKVSQKSNRFKPPSLQQVQDYCNERKNGIQAYAFVNFYQSKGWMIGKNQMKDWKAAIHTWEQKNKQNDASNAFRTKSNGNGLRQSIER